MIKKQKDLLFSLILILFLFGGLAKGQGLVPCGNPGQEPCTFCDFFVLIDNIFVFVLEKIVPPLAVLMIVIGGFLYFFAGSDPNLVERSKQIFYSVAIGLLIVYGGWLLVNLFFQVIGVKDWTGLKNGWWQINCQ